MILIHNILVIDDSEMDNYIAKQMLQRTRISDEVTLKTSAQEALEYLDEQQRKVNFFPEIILLDINMPGMDGFAFLNAFQQYSRKLTEKCSVFILSSSSDPKDMRKAKRSRFVKGYFVKPLTSDKIDFISKTFTSLVDDH